MALLLPLRMIDLGGLRIRLLFDVKICNESYSPTFVLDDCLTIWHIFNSEQAPKRNASRFDLRAGHSKDPNPFDCAAN